MAKRLSPAPNYGKNKYAFSQDKSYLKGLYTVWPSSIALQLLFRISKPFVKIFKTHGKIVAKPLKLRHEEYKFILAKLFKEYL